MARDLLGHSWCGYTTTKITPTTEIEDLPVGVYGGLTFGITEAGWVGFNTAHGVEGGPHSIEAVKKEVEHLVDQLNEIENTRDVRTR